MQRFATVSAEELDEILQNKDAKNTKKQTEILYNVLCTYIDQKKIDINLKTATKREIDDLLSQFYVEVRKANGEMYKKTSFKAIRASIQRKLMNLRGDDFDIIRDYEFNRSNNVFAAQGVVLKKAGLAKVDHHEPISDEDAKLLYSSGILSDKSPASLLHKVFFEIMLHLCRRGQENLRDLKINNFQIINIKGTECVVKTSDELTKNNRDDNQEEGIMKATGRQNCPVSSFKLYISTLNPKRNDFFQRPKETVPLTGPWFDNMALGEKTLANMMKKLSNMANLSQVYTNHCIKITNITILDGCGVETSNIMLESGHKLEASIRNIKTSKSKQLEMSSYRLERTSSTVTMENDQPSTSKNVPQKNFKESRKRQHPTSHFESQHGTLAERFNLETSVPNFNLRAGIDLSDSDNDEESQWENGQAVPSVKQLPDSDDDEESQRENVQAAPSVKQLQRVDERQQEYFRSDSFGSGGNVFYNCTFVINPVNK